MVPSPPTAAAGTSLSHLPFEEGVRWDGSRPVGPPCHSIPIPSRERFHSHSIPHLLCRFVASAHDNLIPARSGRETHFVPAWEPKTRSSGSLNKQFDRYDQMMSRRAAYTPTKSQNAAAPCRALAGRRLPSPPWLAGLLLKRAALLAFPPHHPLVTWPPGHAPAGARAHVPTCGALPLSFTPVSAFYWHCLRQRELKQREVGRPELRRTMDRFFARLRWTEPLGPGEAAPRPLVAVPGLPAASDLAQLVLSDVQRVPCRIGFLDLGVASPAHLEVGREHMV